MKPHRRPNRPGGARIPPASPARESERKGFEQLVQEHERRILTIALQMCGNIDDARDIAQDTFLRAFRSRHRLRRGLPPGPWLNRIAVNAAIDFLRKRRAASTRPLTESDGLTGPQWGPRSTSPAEAPVLGREQADQLFSLLDRLAPRERAAFVLRHLHGLSTEDTARSLGCTRVTVRRHTSRARRKLREVIGGDFSPLAASVGTRRVGKNLSRRKKTGPAVERSGVFIGSNK